MTVGDLARLAALMAVAVVGGCLAPPETCGGGVCPSGSSCVVDVCIVDVGACGAFPNGAACSADGAWFCEAGDCIESLCGDGIEDSRPSVTDPDLPREKCDQGDENSDLEPGRCRPTCQVAHCGDGIADPGEGVECVALEAELQLDDDDPRAVRLVDLDGDGAADLVAARFDTGASRAVVSWWHGWGDGTFAAGVELLRVPALDEGNAAPAFDVADIDQDGDRDLVLAVTDPTGYGRVHLLAQDPDGFTLLPPIELASAVIAGVAVADVGSRASDGGLVDLLVGTRGREGGTPGVTSIFFGRPGAGWPAAADTQFTVPYATQLALADLDADGHADLVTRRWADADVAARRAGPAQPTFEIDVYWGAPSGPSSIATPIAYDVGPFALGDADGEPGVDVAYIKARGTSLVSFGGGRGAPIERADRTTATALVVADTDGDGVGELVALAPAGARVLRALPVTEQGPDFEGTDQPIGDGVEVASVAAADLGGEPGDDLVAWGRRRGDGRLFVLHTGGGSLGRLRELRPVLGSLQVLDVVVGEFDGDGAADLAVIGRLHEIARNLHVDRGDPARPGRLLLPPTPVPAASFPLAIAAGDLDRDGRSDLAIVDGADPSSPWLIVLRSSAGPIEENGGDRYALPLLAKGLLTGDLDGDGAIDVATVDLDSGRLAQFRNGGAGDLGPAVIVELASPSAPAPLQQVELAELDGVAGHDCVFVDRDRTLHVLHGDAGGCGAAVLEQSGIRRVVVAELAPGAPGRLIAVDTSGHLLLVGAGQRPIPIGGGTVGDARLAIADVNGDGLADVITASDALRVFLQVDGASPTFTGAQLIAKEDDPQQLVTTRIDRDGLADAMVLEADGSVWWARGRPNVRAP